MPSPSAAAHAPSFERLTVGATGVGVRRLFTRDLPAGASVYDTVTWDRRTALIVGEGGFVAFGPEQVDVPAQWSQTATNVVASRYFKGPAGSAGRETSARSLIARVVETIAAWGRASGYFATQADADAFHDELVFLLLTQRASFNSPVWFNVGRPDVRSDGWYFDEARGIACRVGEEAHHPQCSACFINSVSDSMESILDLVKTEGMLFKWGSGSGTNFSPLRERGAPIATYGCSSGPLSFMKGLDVFAGVIKSGGRGRRAAKMALLDVGHPDVEAFIWAKAGEERRAHALIQSGCAGGIDGETSYAVLYQNANNSVRVPDAFMAAVVDDDDWWTRSVRGGQPVRRYKARDLLRQIADAAHACGDPGLQFETTIDRAHTCKASGRIHASNPCSEFVFLDDTACNLASINLLPFLSIDGRWDGTAFRHAVDVMILAQDILVGHAGYPTERITTNSHDFRPLGLGYSNLGGLLMSLGLAYDSDAAREVASAISATMGGEAYLASARLAGALGAFPRFAENRESMLEVVSTQWRAAEQLPRSGAAAAAMGDAARETWAEAYRLGCGAGFRNAQTTAIAPTGTIGLMMDCDTLGIEPDLALRKHKQLSGGGVLDLVNSLVPRALQRLGYSAEAIGRIVDHIAATGQADGAPDLAAPHVAVFDCSLPTGAAGRAIHHLGHLRMMAAVQPFVSGAISKTINMPADASVEDVMDAFLSAWRLGLKAVAIYRDSSKHVQPLKSGAFQPAAAAPAIAAPVAMASAVAAPVAAASATEATIVTAAGDAPAAIANANTPRCAECASRMLRSGTCYRCDTCGATTGCS